ncbi:MAG: tetratricopeptide repeat protein [Kaiparowitsia implicata GSE-PSE-MK54-09C]|jgi:curved DNA-binding protein CbpA|nr:tetratricopeptide repeat protein [Kaiparowitsia implicata GSE-PSE-MK54-09C]
MALNIEQGLFGLDCVDHHAVLGVSIDADAKLIRKRYLTLARRLHPDSYTKESEGDRQHAAELLSKLVNPAYEQLSSEKNLSEYLLLLKLKGQQALRQQETIILSSAAARTVAASRGDVDQAYRKAVHELAETQYQQLDQMEEITGQLSELNLVYVMRKANNGDFAAPTASPTTNASPANGAPSSPPSERNAPKPPATKDAIVASYVRRAHEFEKKNNFNAAVKELRDALQLSPKNAIAHSRLGLIYYKTKQTTMAKIHFRKALELNPEDATAQEGMRRLEAPEPNPAEDKRGAKATGKAAKSSSKDTPKDGKSGGGLFGLFGNKKK